MLDSNILKVFHDSRHDILALHDEINTCVSNVLDVSALEVISSQLAVQTKDIKLPGINYLL